MKIVMVGHDADPSRAFAMLKERLGGSHEIRAFLDDGKPFTGVFENIRGAARWADVVLLGMSSDEALAETEITAGVTAQAAGIPFGFYGDRRGCFDRLHFGELRRQAAFFLTEDADEVATVQRVYPGVRVIHSGNPTRDADFMPRFDREIVRGQLEIGETETVLLCPGGKAPSVNIAVWAVLFQSLEMPALARLGRNFRVLLTSHPGDKTPHAIDIRPETPQGIAIYTEIPDFVENLPSSTRVTIVPSSIYETADLVPATDVVVEWDSSTAKTAACQRMPVVSIATPFGRGRLLGMSNGEISSPPTCKDGTSYEVSMNPTQISTMIASLLTEDGFAPMRARQEERYPEPEEPGRALRIMEETLLAIVPSDA